MVMKIADGNEYNTDGRPIIRGLRGRVILVYGYIIIKNIIIRAKQHNKVYYYYPVL